MTLLLNDSEFQSISEYIKKNYGINLEKKKTLIEGRLSFYVEDLGYNSYESYFDFAKKDSSGREMENILSRLTTNHTFFLREQEHFDIFKDNVLPWVDKVLKEKDLRVWSAGCSTGEEPYTISMYAMEYLKHITDKINWDTTILASDISESALTKASKGIYQSNDLSSLPEAYKNEYFTKIDNNEYQVKDFLRRNVAFKKINLLSSFNFKKQFHTIFCRNVMIYFEAPTKTDILNKMYDLLLPGGYFFIGHSESLATLEHKFKYIKPAVYRKE